MKFKTVVFCCVLLLFINLPISAQKSEEDKIKDVISLFFEGLQSGDTLLINKTISNQLKIQTVFKNKSGKPILRTDKVSEFLKSVALKNPQDTWEEELLSFTIQIDGNLASVWTPYKFYFNKKFSHCGINSFHLFNDEKQWKIIYLIDTRRNQNCDKL